MLVAFSPIFVADTKIIFRCDSTNYDVTKCSTARAPQSSTIVRGNPEDLFRPCGRKFMFDFTQKN